MAEMAVIGLAAQDPTMMDHVRRNCLKEDHPDYLDPHSLMAINAFGLDNEVNRALVLSKGGKLSADGRLLPNKTTLELIDRKALRVAAKNVNFGVPYGRSAEAIARQCREEGADVSIEDAQKLIDTYKQTNYPLVAAYLDRCAARVI